jgi:hypothetical protein
MLALSELFRTSAEHTRHALSEPNPMMDAICCNYPDVGLLVCLQSKSGDDSLPDEVVSVVPLIALTTNSRNC